MSEGKLLVDDFSFDREFNQSVATKIIVKQRILKDWYIFNTKHSETYFISKDGQILLISFYCGFKRVETRRIFWSKKNNNITYEELIEKFTKENSYEYILIAYFIYIYTQKNTIFLNYNQNMSFVKFKKLLEKSDQFHIDCLVIIVISQLQRQLKSYTLKKIQNVKVINYYGWFKLDIFY